ncbi:MAG: hypothetical protein AAGI53_12655 [Planctomycetota bacterium]
MKSLANAISVVALANIFAFLAVVGWLIATGRVDTDRIEKTRAMYAEPVALEQARVAREEREAAQASAEAEALDTGGAPVTASESLALRLELSELDRQRLERMKREVADLQRTLARERTLLEEERETFERQRGQFQTMREEIAALEGAEQFQKALGSIEKMKPDDARTVLQELLEKGDFDRVVGYLDAMQERTRTKVMTSFVKDDQAGVAADLLEALRVRGLGAATP